MKTKAPIVTIENQNWLRIPIKTKLILRGDDLIEAIADGLENAEQQLQNEDILFISEKAVGGSQGRYFILGEDELKVRPIAKFLSKFVTKTPAGIGLGMPETMECAMRECGCFRIMCAAFFGGFTRLFGRHGDFYRIAGTCARSIDGPTSKTIPPFNNAVSLSPLDPDGVSAKIAERFNCKVAVADINDLGGNILGCFPVNIDKQQLVEILKDNPLGQGRAQTPVGIIRKVTS